VVSTHHNHISFIKTEANDGLERHHKIAEGEHLRERGKPIRWGDVAGSRETEEYESLNGSILYCFVKIRTMKSAARILKQSNNLQDLGTHLWIFQTQYTDD
jgi:hypothetical protein